jgi:hypothetical protein
VLGADGKVEYLAIVLSGSPNMVEGKMLQIVETSDGTGKTQCDTTVPVLAACRACDSIRALVFDTTCSNTGIRQGADSRLVQELGRVLITWFECRHHMVELFMKPVWIMLFGLTTVLIGLFKIMYPYIKKEEKVLLDIKPWLEEQLREKTVEVMISLQMYPNNKQQFPKNNYREMVELTLAVLGGNVPGVPGGFKFRLPEAFHIASFMANVIYGTIMFLYPYLDTDVRVSQNCIKIHVGI